MQVINVYLTWVVAAIMGRLQDADALMQRYPGVVESVAAGLRKGKQPPLRKLYRGLLLEPDELQVGSFITARQGYEQSVSFSEDRDVACYFARPDTIMSGYVLQERPHVQGYVAEHQPKRAEILWHYAYNPVVFQGMSLDIRAAARRHPASAHDPAQFDFVFGTQKEVILAPLPAGEALHVVPVADSCPDAADLDRRFTPPHILRLF